MDDTTEDDPYRVILWSDIKDYIIDLSLSTSRKKISHILLDAFLIFCRLPPLVASDRLISHQWWHESFARGGLVDCSRSWMNKHFIEVSTVETSPNLLTIKKTHEDRTPINESNLFECPFPNFPGSPDTLLPTPHWAKYLLSWQSFYGTATDSEGPVLFRWIRNALKSLLEANQVDHLAEYYLAFEFCNEPQGIKKVAKSLLKRHPQSLRLYNAYSMIEWFRGNNDVAENITIAALGMRASLPEMGQEDSILLWKSWAWALLDNGNHIAALKCLFSIPDGAPALTGTIDVSSAAAFLKTKQYLSSHRDYLLSSGDFHHATIIAECLALVEYLTAQSGRETTSQSQGDIVSALTVFGNFSEVLRGRNQGFSISNEVLHQYAARLIYHHVRSGPFRPALIRDHLSKSLNLFPRNTIFLSLYAWNESRLRIDDRVRTILRTVALTEENDNIISRLFAIRYEMRVGNVHSTRAAFENAVSSPACSSNPGLWRLYVLFCASKKELRGKVVENFYRGMRACPWAKDYMTIAFTDIKGFMGLNELVSIYRVMEEKELRIHVDVGDRLEELRDGENARMHSTA